LSSHAASAAGRRALRRSRLTGHGTAHLVPARGRLYARFPTRLGRPTSDAPPELACHVDLASRLHDRRVRTDPAATHHSKRIAPPTRPLSGRSAGVAFKCAFPRKICERLSVRAVPASGTLSGTVTSSGSSPGSRGDCCVCPFAGVLTRFNVQDFESGAVQHLTHLVYRPVVRRGDRMFERLR
jgi:hypothetical protein